MKTLRALMLMLALSVCAYAGNMDNGFVPPPPPETNGQIEIGVTDPITELAISLLQSLVSLI